MEDMNPITEWLYTYFDEVEPLEFYRDVFPEGSLEKAGERITGKYTGIICAFEQLTPEERAAKKRPKVRRYTVTDDLKAIQRVTKTDMFCIMSPLSYAGKSRSAEMARAMYGIAIDLDKIRIIDGKPHGLMNLWDGHILTVGRVPKPTYIVSSGTGVHLYYLFDKPIRLYKETAKQLQRLKKTLTRLCWHGGSVTTITDNRQIQYEGIYQGFRMPGTVTKTGSRVRAFQTGPHVTIDYLNEFMSDPKDRVTDLTYKSDYSLAEAKEKFPDWYERRIEKGERRGTWHVSRAVYDWWKRKIFDEASVGHRYFCMWTLAIYAKKCSYYDEKHNPNPVTREELYKDAWWLMDIFENLTQTEDNHFDESDVQAALMAFDDEHGDWTRYHRDYISFRTAIPIKENKRNHRKQDLHLKGARALQAIYNENWRNTAGRPKGSGTKDAAVKEWRQDHPDGTVTEAARALQISRPTVYKYWDS